MVRYRGEHLNDRVGCSPICGVLTSTMDGYMHSLDTKQKRLDFERSFGRHYNMLFGPLIGLVVVIDTGVVCTKTVVYATDISVTEIVILYSLSTCVACSISLLFGYYGVYRESRKNLQDDKPNHLSKIKKRFDFESSYNHHMSILYGPLLFIAITIDSLVVLYTTYLSKAVIVILYSLSIALVGLISSLLGYYGAKRELRRYSLDNKINFLSGL